MRIDPMGKSMRIYDICVERCVQIICINEEIDA